MHEDEAFGHPRQTIGGLERRITAAQDHHGFIPEDLGINVGKLVICVKVLDMLLDLYPIWRLHSSGDEQEIAKQFRSLSLGVDLEQEFALLTTPGLGCTVHLAGLLSAAANSKKRMPASFKKRATALVKPRLVKVSIGSLLFFSPEFRDQIRNYFELHGLGSFRR